MEAENKTGTETEYMRKRRNKAIAAMVAGILVLVLCAGLLVFLQQKKTIPVTERTQGIETERQIPVPINSMDILSYARQKAMLEQTTTEAILGASLPVTEEVRQREEQKRYTELPQTGTENFATIISCKINARTNKVKLQFSMPGCPESDDDRLYLFELPTYATGHGTEYIATAGKWEEGCFLFSLNQSRLYEKYVIAVKKGESYIDISRGHYITNPEAIAKYQYDYPQAASKKGLIVDPAKLGGKELQNLGVKQAAYNIPIGYIMGQTSNANWPTIYYEYNGKTYAFNGQRIAEFDIVFKALTARGIVTTAVLLNNRNSAYPQLIHPDARSGSAPYYMFNASDAEGVEYLAAAATFLAKRYSGTEHGQIVNWVVGNEVNARQAWNYMAYCPVETYTQAYVEAFRVFYTAIKSVNANARVYMCLDQMWNRNLTATDSYDAKDVLDSFNAQICLKGNIDYGVAHHPYPVPLTWPKFWAMPANYVRMNLVKNSVNTPYITVQNIHVLTDYLQQESFLNDKGEVRSVLINEVGFGSDHGENVQAAAYAYAYYIVNANQHIDGFILNKQSDMSVEIAQGLSLGLDRQDGSHKMIYSVFQNIDTASGYDSTAFAKDLIGISDWSQVITAH